MLARWSAVRLAPPLLALALGLVAGLAEADKLDETLDVSLGARGAWMAADVPLAAAPAVDPIPLVDARSPRLRGSQLWGSTLGLGLSLDGLRLGVGTGAVSGAGFRTEGLGSLGDGLTATPSSLWGVVFEGRLGYAFGSARAVQPYVDLRGGLTVLQVQVDLAHGTLGQLGTTPYNAYLPTITARIGLRVPVDSWLFVDASIGASPIGAERASGIVAVGLPIPLSNL